MYLVALFQQQLRQVRAILSRNSRDERDLTIELDHFILKHAMRGEGRAYAAK